MKLPASLALALCLIPFASAQTPQFTDPANLRGERVKPHNGRELPIDQGASGLAQLLRKLNTRASLLNIVAHPDDEDGGMLTLNSRGLGARVADLSLTRGEGGQNAITGDFEDALGLLRTQELLSCDRYSGIDQFFGTEVDFGFSKTKAESFAKWTHERVLYDVVRAIRIYRPLVLTSTWIGGVTDGHGHHQVSGQIAQEAFLAAGDPKVFPELTAEGILPWQPLKIYARVPMQSISDKGLFDYATGQYTPARFTNYVTGEISTTPPSTDVLIHEGAKDPLLTVSAANPSDIPHTYTDPNAQLSYVQFARIGLSLQRSQVGPGVRNAPPGTFDVAYHLYSSRLPASHDSNAQAPKARHITAQGEALGSTPQISQRAEGPTHNAAPDLDAGFFTGIDTSLEGIATLAPSDPTLKEPISKIAALIQQATTQFDPTNAEKIAPTLAEALKQTDTLINSLTSSTTGTANVLHELRIKRVQLNQALILSFGLTYTADVPTSDVPVHAAISARTHLVEHSTDPYRFRVYYNDGQSALIRNTNALPADTGVWVDHPLDSSCTLDAAYSVTPTRPYFSRTDPEQAVYTLSDPSLRNAPTTPPALTCLAILSYKGVEISLSAIATHTTGSTAEPVSLVPSVTIACSSHAQALPDTQQIAWLSPIINGVVSAGQATLTLRATNGWLASPSSAPLVAGPTLFTVSRAGTATPTTTEVQATVTVANTIYTNSYRPIGYGDLPRTNFYTPATTRIVPVDLTLPTHRRIAYLPGTGDAIPEALTSINLTPTILTIADLTPAKLSAYDTIILGVRTYNAHPDLHGAPTQALLDFARNGGNVIVQYQTPEFTAADAPYPLDLGSNEKVVDETAPVHVDTTNAPWLTTPNTINSADFNNWVEERGHGFLSTWDPHYTAPTETHDPGAPAENVLPQAPQRGGLLTTPLGKGHWTYVAFALYRQLPEAVPGAFRLFANLLALADQP